MQIMIDRLRSLGWLAIPKARYSKSGLMKLVGEIHHEDMSNWYVSCLHSVNNPVQAKNVSKLTAYFGEIFPADLLQLLKVTDGALLFQVNLIGLHKDLPEAQHIRYRLFSSTELIEVNKRLWEEFSAILGDDPDFQHYSQLNYLAFCDAHDGNYIAIILEHSRRGQVFLVDHELLYRPYNELDSDSYPIISSSLANWIEQIIESEGWDGFGPYPPSL